MKARLIGFVLGCIIGATGMTAHIGSYVSAVTLEAQQAPLFGLSGTDPSRFATAIERLANITEELAALQESPDDARAVATLYPLEFLRTLAELERARIALVSDPSLVGAREYEDRLDTALRAGIREGREFKEAFERITEGDTRELYALSGLATRASMLDGIDAIIARFEHAAEESTRRWYCRRLLCGISEISLPPQTPPHAPAPDTRSAEGFFVASAQGTSPRTLRVTLAESACVRELPSPYVFLVFQETLRNGRPRSHFVNDIFFAPTREGRGPILDTLSEMTDYAIVRPSTFYACRASQSDAGMLNAISSLHDTATEYPEIEPALRTEFLEQPSEATALAYARVAARSAPEFDPIRLALEQRSARFEVLIEEISDVLTSRIAQRERGIGFDLSARTLFLTHSAFPSLYLGHDLSVIPTPVTITSSSPEAFRLFTATHMTYAELEPLVGRDTLIRAAKTLRDFDTE